MANVWKMKILSTIMQKCKQKKNCKSFILRHELTQIKKPITNFSSIFRSKKFLDAGLEHDGDEDDFKGIKLDQL